MANSTRSTVSAQQTDDLLDPEFLARRKVPSEAVHLNVRITGDDARILEYLQKRTPGITDSLRIRDCVRTAVFVLAMRERGTPVEVKTTDGSLVEMLEHLGVFMPEPGASRSRRRVA